MFRPAVVSEYRSAASNAPRMRVFTVVTWACTLGAGAVGAFATTYKTGPKGEHALSGAQRFARGVYDDVLRALNK